MSPDQALLLQALAEKVTGNVIMPLIRAGDRAAVHQTEERGAGAALQRRDSADAREGGLEAALLAALRFLSGTALHRLQLLLSKMHTQWENTTVSDGCGVSLSCQYSQACP